MDRRNPISISRRIQSANSLAQTLFKQELIRAARVMGPTLFALMVASASGGVIHAQRTKEFSGAQCLWERSLYLRPASQLLQPAMLDHRNKKSGSRLFDVSLARLVDSQVFSVWIEKPATQFCLR